MVHYVELIRQNPQFTEAPCPKTDSARLTAPYSDANRHASMPNPTGDKSTNRPGEGGFYTPPAKSGAEETARARQMAAAESELAAPSAAATTPTFQYRPTQASAANRINWSNAIREVGKIASIGTGQHGVDLGGQIPDLTILSSATVAPDDFAAKKAIELSSPLNPLPADFPNATERVTCMFFYNQAPPNR